MARPLRAVVDLAALRENCRLARQLAGGSRLAAVVKADGYGHGAVPVARALADRVECLAVASLEEARELRAAGLETPVLLLEGCFEAGELNEAARQRLDLVVHSSEQVQALLGARLAAPLRIWLKLDSGMHRLGLPAEGFRTACETLRAAPQVAGLVLMTHFARADETGSEFTRHQLERFRRAATGLEGDTSLANSAAILAWPEARSDWARPGLMLYGVSPLDRSTPDGERLVPVMTLEAQIIAVRDLPAGEPIGYGGRFVTDGPTRVGVVAVGYGDGYPRHARDGTPVLVAGQRTRLVGRVSMDMITVDLTGLPEAGVGAPVELWGRRLPITEVAASCDTIAYELLTGLTPRVARSYVGASP